MDYSYLDIYLSKKMHIHPFGLHFYWICTIVYFWFVLVPMKSLLLKSATLLLHCVCSAFYDKRAIVFFLIFLFSVCLFFSAPPKFLRTPTDQTGVQGGVASFVCQATGDPRPKIVWNKKGKKVSNQRFEVLGLLFWCKMLDKMGMDQHCFWLRSHATIHCAKTRWLASRPNMPPRISEL